MNKIKQRQVLNQQTLENFDRISVSYEQEDEVSVKSSRINNKHQKQVTVPKPWEKRRREDWND